MAYHINDMGDGRYELLEVRPTVVGILTSRHIAERFAEFLTAAEEQEQDQLAEIERFGGSEPFPAPDAPAENLLLLDVGDDPTLTSPEPIPQPIMDDPAANPAQAEAAPIGQDTVSASDDEAAQADALRRLETPLQEALRRLEAGEALAVVCDETGFAMNKLRGIWANLKKREKQTVVASEAECTTCGKTYHAGAIDEGLCARCTRDLGRN